MIENIISWFTGVILHYYPFALVFVLFFHLGKSIFRKLDRTLILQIINVWTAIASIFVLFWIPEFTYYTIGIGGKKPESEIHPEFERFMLIYSIFSIIASILPQLFWIKKIRKNIWISLLVMIICSQFLFRLYASEVFNIEHVYSSNFNFSIKEEIKNFIRHDIPSLGFYILIIFVPYYKIIKSAKYKETE